MTRPRADVYPFGLRDPIPSFPVPLADDDPEPTVELNRIVHELYDRAGYDLAIHYDRPPSPPLPEEDAGWAQALLRPAGG
jgi:hypothetical protein